MGFIAALHKENTAGQKFVAEKFLVRSQNQAIEGERWLSEKRERVRLKAPASDDARERTSNYQSDRFPQARRPPSREAAVLNRLGERVVHRARGGDFIAYVS
jgi:hypothetical protein